MYSDRQGWCMLNTAVWISVEISFRIMHWIRIYIYLVNWKKIVLPIPKIHKYRSRCVNFLKLVSCCRWTSARHFNCNKSCGEKLWLNVGYSARRRCKFIRISRFKSLKNLEINYHVVYPVNKLSGFLRTGKPSRPPLTLGFSLWVGVRNIQVKWHGDKFSEKQTLCKIELRFRWE